MKKILNVAEAGRSMLEALGYISIMLILTVSMAAAVNRGYYKYRAGRINQELSDLKKNISHRWVAAEDYSEVDFETLVNEKILPLSIGIAPNKKSGVHSFGGKVTIGPVSGNESFFIKFETMPIDVCMDLASKMWTANDGSDLDKMLINGKSFCWPFSVSRNCDYQLPVKTSDVFSACKIGNNDKRDNWKAKIEWQFN